METTKRAAVAALLVLLTALSAPAATKPRTAQALWPDGTPMEAWFADTAKVDVATLGRQYVLTDWGVLADSTLVQTEAIQRVIDRAASRGGGVVVVPRGTFLSGALFFRQGTHLHVSEGGRLKGSDRIKDFPLLTTRMEGETCRYFAALVNADGLDGFTISGHGTIDGNGLNYWQEFWMRRQWNPACTNKDAQRPRLTYVSNSQNVTIQDVRLVNSPFWTNHVYRSHHVRFLACHIFAPTENVWPPEPQRGAPSSDAIDLDAVSDVLVNGCYMHVSDAAVVLKGGKGTWADRDPDNGPCERILVQHCRYGRVYGCLTLGSEAIHCRNVILRHCHAERADRVLWLKMRTDTPQHYEHIRVEDISGRCGSLLFIRPWTQFYNPQERADMPRSRCNDVAFSRITVKSRIAWDVETSEKYLLERFSADGQPLTF